MYFLIGGDGKEYGPKAAVEVREWIAEGRLNAQSKIKPGIEARLKQLEQMKYPVQKVESADAKGRLDAAGRQRLARWIDSLDKI